MIKLLSILLVLFYAGHPPLPQAVANGPEKLQQQVIQLKEYAVAQKCCDKIGILIDMSIASRRNRFFVADLQTGTILISGLCAHGQGNDVNREDVVFSNKPGSYCTSQGRYKIGAKFEGEFGTGYRLYGLDPTNCNALIRDIVFHAHPGVPDKEDPKVVTRSNGCPMVSQKVFRATEKLIDAQDKPVLMWIYK